MKQILAFVLLLVFIGGQVHVIVADLNNGAPFEKFFSAETEAVERGPIYVTTKNGTMKGYRARAANNRTIHTFMRIPFATPPIGDLRFKAPQPQDGWQGILDATQLTPACPQFLTGVVTPSEDCLYLNVYSSRTGNETDRAPAPVMVYMFGGGFLLGESSYYTGHRFLTQDIVLVVPNYRVSLLGFLATGDEASVGNYGLKDQNLALRWVQENIAAFGGDPNRVTIFGESAGGASVIFHLLSPVSHGLFHGVIAQSGSALTPWAVDPNPQKTILKIAKAINCTDTSSSQAIVDCARQLPTINLTANFLYGVIREDLIRGDLGLAGTNVVVEPDIPGAFLSKDPYVLLKEGNYPDVPVMIGAVANEGSLFLGGFHYLGFGRPAVINDTVNNPVWMREELMKHLTNTYGVDEKAGNVALEETLALAFNPDDDRLDFVDMGSGLVNMLSVLGIKGAVLKTADILSEKLSNVYLYSFRYAAKNPNQSLWYYMFQIFVPIMGGKEPPVEHGVIHGDDGIYQFQLPFGLDDRDETFSEMFVKLWVDFATNGSPTWEGSALPEYWPRYSWPERKYYVIDETPNVATDYAQEWILGPPKSKNGAPW